MVFNQLGEMLGASWITLIIAIPILVVGHVFNIAVSALGAYVHSSRLQYIEFFGKFFEGGGRAFRPLGIKSKFTEILEEEAI
jgi:V/A-type H+-transporting ATPase subunit I